MTEERKESGGAKGGTTGDGAGGTTGGGAGGTTTDGVNSDLFGRND